MRSATVFGLTVAGTSGGEEIVICPFHDDKKPSAWWNPSKELFYCAVCNRGMNVVGLVYNLRLDPELIHDEEGEDPEREIPDYDMVRTEIALDTGVIVPDFWYLEERRIRPEVVKRFKVGVFCETIVFPICNMRGKLTGALYRILPSGFVDIPRYKKMGEMQPVWPMPELNKYRAGNRILIVEGAFSAMRIASVVWNPKSARVPALALMGAKANQKIVDALAPFNPIFLYDNDDAGRNAMRKMKELAPHWHSFVLKTSPDDMSDRQVVKLIELLDGLPKHR